MFGGQAVKAGNIIVRQRGTKFKPRNNAGIGRDFTLFAKSDGILEFIKNNKKGKVINVLPKA